MEHKTAAIIVTYNRKELLKESLEHLCNQSYKEFDIYIIDNASTDNTYDYIKNELNDHMYYLNTGSNLGGAGGFQFGIKHCFKEGYENFWIMDDDTMPTRDALLELIEADKLLQGEYGFLCSDVKWIDGSACLMNVPNLSNEWIKYTEIIKQGYVPVKQCSFVSCFFKRKMIQEVGLPIKEFFVWGDDAEYTYRLSHKKVSYFIPQSVVIHKMKSNIPTDISQDSVDRLFRYNYSYRNMYYINKTQGTKLSMLLYYYGVYLDIKKVIKTNKNGRWKKIKVILKSVRAGKKFKPQIEFPNEL